GNRRLLRPCLLQACRTTAAANSLAAAGGAPRVAGAGGERSTAAHRLRARRRPQLARERRIDDELQVVAANGNRLVGAAGDRVEARLLREFCRRALRRPDGRSHTGGALAAGERFGQLRLRREAVAINRRRPDLVGAVFTTPRRHAERARLRVAVRRARRRTGAGLAGWPLDEGAGGGRRGRHR